MRALFGFAKFPAMGEVPPHLASSDTIRDAGAQTQKLCSIARLCSSWRRLGGDGRIGARAEGQGSCRTWVLSSNCIQSRSIDE